MARNRSKTKRELDRTQAVALYVQGYTQQEIAKELGCSQQMISKDLQMVRKRWVARQAEFMDEIKLRQLAKIDAIEEKATQGWINSLKDRKIINRETTTQTGENGTDSIKRGRKIEGRDGDPRWLDIILRCIAQQNAILGVHESDEIKKEASTVNKIIVITQPQTPISEAAQDLPKRLTVDHGKLSEAENRVGKDADTRKTVDYYLESKNDGEDADSRDMDQN